MRVARGLATPYVLAPLPRSCARRGYDDAADDTTRLPSPKKRQRTNKPIRNPEIGADPVGCGDGDDGDGDGAPPAPPPTGSAQRARGQISEILQYSSLTFTSRRGTPPARAALR